MMSAVTDWLRQVVAAAFFSAAMAALIPSGAVKRITMLACSVLLLLALFRPFMGETGQRQIGDAMARMEYEILSAAEDLDEENRERWAGLIEKELVSYIETRAKEAGFPCSAEITLRCNEEGVPLPVAAVLTAKRRSEEVHRCVREELGIAEENIQWRIG